MASLVSANVCQGLLDIPSKSKKSIKCELSVAVCCSANVNRSMAAHKLLKEHGIKVKSFGVSSSVRLPAPGDQFNVIICCDMNCYRTMSNYLINRTDRGTHPIDVFGIDVPDTPREAEVWSYLLLHLCNQMKSVKKGVSSLKTILKQYEEEDSINIEHSFSSFSIPKQVTTNQNLNSYILKM
ncbi:hypothetical protein WA158_002518 [Blastocystis sp. Blastoise]